MSKSDQANAWQPGDSTSTDGSKAVTCRSLNHHLIRELIEDPVGGIYSRRSNPPIFHRIDHMRLTSASTFLQGKPIYSGRVHVPNLPESVPLVDLTRSKGLVTSTADQEFARIPLDQGNCHLYTGTFVLRHIPEIGWPNNPLAKNLDHWWRGAHLGMFFSRQFLANRGYKQLQPSQARAGDVLLAVDGDDRLRITHSAVLLGRKQDGAPLIRQKFDQNHPVVDLTAEQFGNVYMNHGELLEVWGRR